jgi:hypothetical protein
MTSNIPNLSNLNQIQELTKRYSTYSRRAAGIALIITGLTLGILSIYLLKQPSASLILRMLFCAIVPLIWYAAQETCRNQIYQRQGIVLEGQDQLDQRQQKTLRALLITTVALAVIGSLLFTAGLVSIEFSLGLLTGSVFTGLIYLVLGRTFDSSLLMLFAWCALILNGTSESTGFVANLQHVLPLIIGLYLIGLGLYDHQQFGKLEAQLQNLRGQS